MDPDPRGPKTYASNGSGSGFRSATLKVKKKIFHFSFHGTCFQRKGDKKINSHENPVDLSALMILHTVYHKLNPLLSTRIKKNSKRKKSLQGVKKFFNQENFTQTKFTKLKANYRKNFQEYNITEYFHLTKISSYGETQNFSRI
jgi:hypothetical protein